MRHPRTIEGSTSTLRLNRDVRRWELWVEPDDQWYPILDLQQYVRDTDATVVPFDDTWAEPLAASYYDVAMTNGSELDRTSPYKSE